MWPLASQTFSCQVSLSLRIQLQFLSKSCSYINSQSSWQHFGMSATIPTIQIRNLRQEEGRVVNQSAQGQTTLNKQSEASNSGLLISNPRLFVLHQIISLRFHCEDELCPNVKISSEFSLLCVWGSCWLHFALSKLLFLPASITRNIHLKNKRVLPLNSLVERVKSFSVPFLDSRITVVARHSPDLCSYCPLYVLFSHIHLSLPGTQTDIWHDKVCCCCFPRDLTVHFFLGRARVSFKSFSPGFLRNLSVWHVCHFSQSSSESWQFSHNGICWQVVRADSEYVWKTVKLVEKKIKERASLHLKQHVKL